MRRLAMSCTPIADYALLLRPVMEKGAEAMDQLFKRAA
jgi:hypothetical protein